MKSDDLSHPLPQHRIVQPGDLHTPDGRLMETGWATAPIRRYDPDRIRAPRWRVKAWDYYCVVSDYGALALMVSDNGYFGLDSVSLMDFEARGQVTATRLKAFPMGKRGLPDGSGAGVIRAAGRQYELTFRNDGRQRHLYGHVYDMPGGPLLFDLILQELPGDSMVIVTPFRNRPRLFYYNQKINCMAAEGRCIHSDREQVFSPATAFAVLDWGRGVWPYRCTWYWASASGMVQGQRFGLNLGYGFGDTSQASENMLFFGGVAHKLGRVRFDIPGAPGRERYLEPWGIEDDQGRLRLRFEPILDRAARTDALLIASDQHQVFGRFSGSARLDDGRTLDIRGLTGFAEKVRNRF